MKPVTKQEMVLEIYDREAMGEVTSREIEVIQCGLVAAFGEGGTMSPAEIARVLLDEDLPVRLDHVFRMGHPFDRYEELFSNCATAANFEVAAAVIRFLDDRRNEFLASGDRTGVRFAIRTGQRARQNALAIAERSAPPVPAIQREIAQWFTIWLQTPEIFHSWLEIRRATTEFKRLATLSTP